MDRCLCEMLRDGRWKYTIPGSMALSRVHVRRGLGLLARTLVRAEHGLRGQGMGHSTAGDLAGRGRLGMATADYRVGQSLALGGQTSPISLANTVPAFLRSRVARRNAGLRRPAPAGAVAEMRWLNTRRCCCVIWLMVRK